MGITLIDAGNDGRTDPETFTWSRPESSSPIYPAGFSPIDLTTEGGL